MLRKIKDWLHKVKVIRSADLSSSYVPTPLVQEDTRSTNAVKRVVKAFEQQQDVMHARSLKSHDITCTDPLTCSKSTCFIREPDKIVSEPYDVPLRKRKVVKAKKQ